MSLGTLRTRVRAYLDESDEAFWTNAQLNTWINDAYEYYYLQMVEAFQGDFENAPASFDIVSGQAEYDLPEDFLKCIRVERVYQGLTIPLRNMVRSETANFTSNTNFSNFYQPTYYFRGTQLILEPTPNSDIEDGMIMLYVPLPTRMVNDDDDVAANFVGPYQNCIVLRAAVSAKIKEEMVGNQGSDPTGLQAELSKWEQILKEIIQQKTTARQYTSGWGLEDAGYFTY